MELVREGRGRMLLSVLLQETVWEHSSLLGSERKAPYALLSQSWHWPELQGEETFSGRQSTPNDRRWTRILYRLLGDQQKMAYMELWKHRKKTFEHPGVKRKQGCTEQTVGKRSESNEWDGLNRRQHCEATQVSGRWQHFTTGRPESAEGCGILSRTTQCDTNTMSEISSSPKCSYSTMQNTGEWKKSRSDKKKSSSPKQLVHFSLGHIPAKL